MEQEQQKSNYLIDLVMNTESDINNDLRTILVSMLTEQERTRAASEQRLEHLETLVADHVRVCSANEASIKELIEVMHAVQGSMTVANWIKRVLVWSAAVGGSIYAFYKMIKGEG